MLKEGAAMGLVQCKIPDLHRRTAPPWHRAGAGRISRSTASPPRRIFPSGKISWSIKQLKKKESSPFESPNGCRFTAPLDELQNNAREGGTTDPWLRTGALKMVTDGALGSRTAAMLAPYSDDPSTSGILTMDPDKLRALAIERDKAGFQLNFPRHRRPRQSRLRSMCSKPSPKPTVRATAATASNTRRSSLPEDFPRFARLQGHRFDAAIA